MKVTRRFTTKHAAQAFKERVLKLDGVQGASIYRWHNTALRVMVYGESMPADTIAALTKGARKYEVG